MFTVKVIKNSDVHTQMLLDIDVLGKTLYMIRDQYTTINRLWQRTPTNAALSKQKSKLDSWEYTTLCALNTLEAKLCMPFTSPMNMGYAIPSMKENA